MAYYRSQQPDLAQSSLEELFARARAQDARARPVFEQARRLYADLQSVRAERQHSEAFKAVENLRVEMERLSGYPVRVTEGDFKDTTGATIQMAWKHQRSYHLITLRKSLRDDYRTHLQAHELIHLQLEVEARTAGKNRFFVTTDKTEATAAQRLQGGLRKLERSGQTPDSIRKLVQMWTRGLANFVFNCPLDMVIETRLRERMPALAAAQFASTRNSVGEAITTNLNPDIREITPPLVLRSVLALNGAYTLFLDHLYQGATNYTADYQREESFPISQRLFRLWLSHSTQLAPGYEYVLVDEFAEILGLRGWFDWRVDPGEHEIAEAAAKEGTTNSDLLATKHLASVQYLLDALKRYERMPVEKIREIALEIGIVGQRGLDYASPETKYELKSVPGEKFSGLHLMCLMYAGFKRIAPDHDLQMELNEPFLTALEMFQHGSSGRSE